MLDDGRNARLVPVHATNEHGGDVSYYHGEVTAARGGASERSKRAYSTVYHMKREVQYCTMVLVYRRLDRSVPWR